MNEIAAKLHFEVTKTVNDYTDAKNPCCASKSCHIEILITAVFKKSQFKKKSIYFKWIKFCVD